MWFCRFYVAAAVGWVRGKGLPYTILPHYICQPGSVFASSCAHMRQMSCQDLALSWQLTLSSIDKPVCMVSKNINRLLRNLQCLQVIKHICSFSAPAKGALVRIWGEEHPFLQNLLTPPRLLMCKCTRAVGFARATRIKQRRMRSMLRLQR